MRSVIKRPVTGARQAATAANGVWQSMQRGLVYPAPFAAFATFFAGTAEKPLTKARLSALLRDVRKLIHREYGSANTSAIGAVGFARWQQWEPREWPAGMALRYPVIEPDGKPSTVRSDVFERGSGTYADSQADLFFHIKSDDEAHCEGVFAFIRKRLEEVDRCADPALTQYEIGKRRQGATDKDRGGKVLGCRFAENLQNPSDPLTIAQHVLVGDEDPAHRGASFLLAQRFVINWDHILNMSAEQIEDLIGRTTAQNIIPTRDDRSHIKSSRAQDANGNTTPVLRLGLPYGHSAAPENRDLSRKGATLRDERGLYFAGYADSVQVLESVMNGQIGDRDAAMRDRLLNEVSADLGGFYYVPSNEELDLEPVAVVASDATFAKKRFPGIDWSRLDRHFDKRSKNGYMYYNQKDYLYRMTTVSGDDRVRADPPSERVLALLANTFSRWQDNWYVDRAQPDMLHLRVYAERAFGAREAERIMGLSVAERSAWAMRMAYGHVLVSHDYGFRGRRQGLDGNWISGADTYRIQPQELIVGALPNTSLGQGRHGIDFATDDERTPRFIAGLTWASGVGHVVPHHQKALAVGIGGLLDDLQHRLKSAPAGKREFYSASIIALQGVQEHCRAYATLARETNLHDVAQRMDRLASQKPATMLEAAQLVFTLHACLHLTGEPTAIGRLDQMLYPFYEADRKAKRITDAQAQEIVDCFWIKIGEKVQPNRMFVEDHQPMGNLAMAGFSTPPYPQGGANNQWIQQCTVGGTAADGSPAYNAVTMFALRAARRLPLNAPCLSLRVRHDTPQEYLDEAARALLSGGAHPILLNDDKIIPGLLHSGDDVGKGDGRWEATPVAKKANGLWKSDVDVQSARDYACDGCYEPQFVGKNWFTLGGFSMLTVLEAALNQGKSYNMAGPVWFRGQRVSVDSKPPAEIRTFEELLDIFFMHMRMMYVQQVDGQIGAFGAMAALAPTPLLSVLMDDCIEKGLDFYGGGARFNVIAPCFTALTNTVNSLYAIDKMVFDPRTAVTSLPELVDALIADWGYAMQEPFVSTLAGPARIEAQAERYKQLREIALALPKFGRGRRPAGGDDQDSIDAFGDAVMGRVARVAQEAFTNPIESTAQSMLAKANQFGTKKLPFGGFQIQPGTGTFENYFEFGTMNGASAEGRRNGEPLASDLTPTPSPQDLPVEHQPSTFPATFAAYGAGAQAFCDGAPIDMCIREEYPEDQLADVLRAFADGAGSNLLTVTTGNPETLSEARTSPEQYDLVRVRMGGWTEFFVAMFPGHQEQHRRRPLEIPT